MGLAGEPEQNLWKEMSCGQNLEKQRLRITELNLRINETYYLPSFMTQVVGATSRKKGRDSQFSVLRSQFSDVRVCWSAGLARAQREGEGSGMDIPYGGDLTESWS